MFGKTLALDGTGFLDALPDRERGFAGDFAGHILVLHGRDFDMDVDAVEKRSGNAVAVALDIERAAPALAFRIAEVAALAGIHGGDEHEIRWKCEGAGSARNGDARVFQRLAQDFEGLPTDLGQFVEKEDAVVGDADLAGIRSGATGNEGDIGNGVVQRTKRACRDEGNGVLPLARSITVNSRDPQTFAICAEAASPRVATAIASTPVVPVFSSSGKARFLPR